MNQLPGEFPVLLSDKKSFRVCVGDEEESNQLCPCWDFNVGESEILLQKRRLWLLRRVLLSASAAHHQRAAEIGRKHCCENPAAAARNGEKNLPGLYF